VGGRLLARGETWPKKWRPELSAVLQSAYQVGYLVAAASLAVYSRSVHDESMTRWIFLVGTIPALITYWIRKNIPEPDEWQSAREKSGRAAPSTIDLFRGPVLKTTLLTIMVCSVALTAIWGLIFWSVPQLQNLPDIGAWSKVQKQAYSSQVVVIATLTAILGNFFAAFLARRFGYRVAAGAMFLGGVLCMSGAYGWGIRMWRCTSGCRSLTSSSREFSGCFHSTSRRSSQRCCGPRAQASAITSAGWWRRSAQWCRG